MSPDIRVPGYTVEVKENWLVIKDEGCPQVFCIPADSLISIAETLLRRRGKIITNNDTENLDI